MSQRLVRSALSLVLAAATASCSGGSSAKAVSEGCADDSECAAGLRCIAAGSEAKQCTTSCTGWAKGGNDQVCIDSAHNGHGALCDDGSSTCRAACTNGEACPPGSRCEPLGVQGDTRKACYRD